MDPRHIRLAAGSPEHLWRRPQTPQETVDLQEWRACCAEVRAIRKKYDPGNKWTTATPLPTAYLQELAALHERHKALLLRMFAALFAGDD